MNVLFISNIPSPYRLDFFNELGKYIDLTVLFEAERNYDLNEKWYTDSVKTFKAVFLKKGAIEEKKINFAIIRFLSKNKFDKIIITNYSYYTELIGLLYLKLAKRRICYELDGAIIKKDGLMLHKIKQYLLAGGELYFSPSANTDLFLENYCVDKSKIVRYPFTSLFERDIDKILPSVDEKKEIRKRLKIPYKKVILSVGQFIHRKGYDILIEACKGLSEDVGIYIVGGEPTEGYMKMVKDTPNIHFVDFKAKSELSDYYEMADIFVLPTRHDVWGLVVNEAMAHGLPVITTDKCAAGNELVENGVSGYIVEAENINALKNKICELIDDEKKIECMSAATIKKIKGYTIEKMVEVHIKALL